MFHRFATALAAIVCLALPQLALAADPGAYKVPDAPIIGPPCDAPKVLARIAERFDATEGRYWHTGVRMAFIEYPRQASTRLWPPETTIIRYCTATAHFTDGARHEVVYWLRSATGFAGYGWGVEFCLVGHDRHMSYAPQCRQLRPM